MRYSLCLIVIVAASVLLWAGLLRSLMTSNYMEVVTLFRPHYWPSGDVKVIIAIIFVATAIVLPPLVPKMLSMIRETKLSQRKLELEDPNRELAALPHRSEPKSLSQTAHEAVKKLHAPSGKAAPEPSSSEAEEPSGSAPVILVAEDDSEMRRFIVDSLAAEYRVVNSVDGHEALERAKEFHPDLIIADLMMPGFTGEDLLTEIRRSPEFDGTPVMLLVADADRDLRARVLQAGAQDCILKPFSVQELRVRVHNLASIGQVRKVLQRELATQCSDVQQLVQEVTFRNRQLHSTLETFRLSELRFRRLVDSNIVGVITVALDGRIREANDAFLNMVGYTRQELVAGSVRLSRLTAPENRSKNRQIMETLRDAGSIPPSEHEYLRKDGTRLPALVGAAVLEIKPPTAIAFVIDLAERKRADARVAVQYDTARVLAESENLVQASPRLLQHIGSRLEWDFGEIWTVTPENRLQCISMWHAEGTQFPLLETYTQQVRFAAGEGLPGRVWQTQAPSWITDVEREPEFARVPLLRQEGIHSGFGFPIVLGSGVLGTITFFSRRRTEPDHELLETMAGLGRQIGQFIDRKRSERALRESNERLRTMAEAIPQIVWTAEPDGAIDYFNERWYQYTGTTGGKGWSWQPIIHPEDLPQCLERWTHALRIGGTYEAEHRFRRYDGVYRWYLGRALPVRDTDGNITKWFGTATDIHEQKEAEQAIREMAAIVESSDDAIFSKTLEGNIRSWNAGAQRIYGYTAEEIIGKHVNTLAPPDRNREIDDIMSRLRRGERIRHLETKRVTKSGKMIDVAVTISPIRDSAGRVVGASTIARDVTEMRRAEAALRNAEKLATVGRLAATIAHEINNPLEAVSNVLYLLATHSSLDGSASEYVNLAQQEVSRIAHIVRQTLGFYRESQMPVPVNIQQLIDNVIELYGRKLQMGGISIERNYDPASDVLAFPAEMRQVFSNLIVNAAEAMPNGGRLRIHIHASRNWSNSAKRGIRITVADTGLGIKREHRVALFEPFFTTKGEKGTGLGLWVSNGIIVKHGGNIRVRSCTKPGKTGTVFSVFLPGDGTPVPSGSVETGTFVTDLPQSAA